MFSVLYSIVTLLLEIECRKLFAQADLSLHCLLSASFCRSHGGDAACLPMYGVVKPWVCRIAMAVDPATRIRREWLCPLWLYESGHIAGGTDASMDNQSYVESSDVFLTKLDSSRAFQWTVQFGSSYDEANELMRSMWTASECIPCWAGQFAPGMASLFGSDRKVRHEGGQFGCHSMDGSVRNDLP